MIEAIAKLALAFFCILVPVSLFASNDSDYIPTIETDSDESEWGNHAAAKLASKRQTKGIERGCPSKSIAAPVGLKVVKQSRCYQLNQVIHNYPLYPSKEEQAAISQQFKLSAIQVQYAFSNYRKRKASHEGRSVLKKQLSEAEEKVLREWLQENLDHPYISHEVAVELAGRINKNEEWVRRWFHNARSRNLEYTSALPKEALFEATSPIIAQQETTIREIGTLEKGKVGRLKKRKAVGVKQRKIDLQREAKRRKLELTSQVCTEHRCVLLNDDPIAPIYACSFAEYNNDILILIDEAGFAELPPCQRSHYWPQASFSNTAEVSDYSEEASQRF